MNQSAKDATIPELELRRSRVSVCIERHLQSELLLLEGLDQLSKSLSTALNESGVTGLSMEQSEKLESISKNLSASADEVRSSRKNMMEMIRDVDNTNEPSVRKFIETLDEPSRSRLEATRMSLLDRLTDIHASMLGNQAVMFYTHDFNRKLVAGILGTADDEKRYGVDGNSSGIKPGNLIQKAC